MCRVRASRDLYKVMLIGSLSLTIVACNTISPTPSPTRRSETPTAIATFAPSPTRLGTFNLTAEQAREVTTFMEFIRAYNAGQFDASLALLDEQVIGNDCDYGSAKVISFQGKSEAAEWLRQRIADHDRLEVSRLLDENPDPQTGRHVIGVEFARRRNTTLQRLGFPQGITPKLRAKVVFTADEPTRILGFANSGNSDECRPG